MIDCLLALTLYQPFATLLLQQWEDGRYVKTTETRGWKPAKPEEIGWIAIHAGMNMEWLRDAESMRRAYNNGLRYPRIDHAAERFGEWYNRANAVVNAPLSETLLGGHGFPTGAIIGVAKLAACEFMNLPYVSKKITEGGSDYAFGDYEIGRFAWIFSERRWLDSPIRAKGRLRLWKLTPDQRDQIRRQTA